MEDQAARTSYLIRMFNLSFAAFALLPLLVYFYLFLNYNGNDAIAVSKDQFEGMVFIIGITNLFLFALLGKLFRKIVLLNEEVKKALLGKVDERTIQVLTKDRGEVAELARTFERIMLRLKNNIRDLEETKHTLYQILNKVGRALTSRENFDFLVRLVLETAVDALRAQKGVVISYEKGISFKVKAAVGIDNYSSSEIVKDLDFFIHQAIDRQNVFSDSSFLDRQKIFSHSLVCVPLICHDKVWGVICIGDQFRAGEFSRDELVIISNLSYQIAISFENAALNKDKEKTYFETMAALAMAVEARDIYSRGHSERVGYYAGQIARALNLEAGDIKTLEDAARLHDIGKIGIGDAILNKPDKLSVEERLIIEGHPLIGESIVAPLKTFAHLLDPIRHHHEFLDGSGYPDRLKGEQIPLITRILTVADIFDALTSRRVYRQGLSLSEVEKKLRDMSREGKLDGRVVDCFVGLLGQGHISLPD